MGNLTGKEESQTAATRTQTSPTNGGIDTSKRITGSANAHKGANKVVPPKSQQQEVQQQQQQQQNHHSSKGDLRRNGDEEKGVDSDMNVNVQAGATGLDAVGAVASNSQGNVENAQGEQDSNELIDQLEDDDRIPMVFRWDGGGRNVYITGTFNAWKEKIPMRRSGNDFSYIRELKRGRHAYKFIVDDEWRFALDQPTVADPHGYINNFVDLTNFECTYGKTMLPLGNRDHITSDDLYGNFSPDPNDPQWYAKEPPPLPPHLRQIILNTPHSNDTMAAKSMQVPQHVTLNHLYCSAIKENLMVLGVSQRYREKFVTTVFYSPLPDINLVGRAAAAVSLNDGVEPPVPRESPRRSEQSVPSLPR